MRLELNQFAGMVPLVDDTAISEKFAAFAKNVRFDRGVLTPAAFSLIPSADFPDSTLAAAGIESVSKMFGDGTRFAFQNIDGEDAFPSPVSPSDTYGRIYYLSPRGPEYVPEENYVVGGLTVNPVGYRLGVPAPSLSPTAQANNDHVDVENADPVTVAYVYTYVDRYGHESAPSAASSPVTLYYDEAVSVAITASASLPTRVRFNGGAKRFYRATFDGSDSVFQYVADIPITSTTWTDTVKLGEESEALITGSWYPAPDSLQQLCLVSSAFCAGFFDHYLCYSEVRLPHAWPPELQYPLKYNPVKLMPCMDGLVIATNGRPYWAEGSDPYSAIPRELPISAPCYSAGSVVDMGDYVMFASFEGLVAVSPGKAEIATEGYLSRDDVVNLIDHTCHAFRYDNSYVFSTKDGRWMMFTPQKGLVEYDFAVPSGGLRGVSYNVRDNRAYFVFGNGTIRIVDYTGSMSQAEWHSRRWRTPPVSFSCIRVLADNYPVTVEVKSQYLSHPEQTSGTITINDDTIARIPVAVGSLWQVVVKPPADCRVYSVVLAQSGREAQ